MLEMRVNDVAEQIVMHVFTEGTGQRQGGDGGREREALYFNFDLRLSSYENEFNRFQYTAARGLHLLYHKLPRGGYISVFSAVSLSPFDRLKTIQEWKHEATHDSCWRDVRVFTQTYFEMAEEVNARRVDAGLQVIAPAEMSQYCNFAGFDQLFQWVPVEITKDPNDGFNYRRLITVGKKTERRAMVNGKDVTEELNANRWAGQPDPHMGDPEVTYVEVEVK